MSAPARTRSGFGQFQLGRSGIGVGVDYSQVETVSTADMAAPLRDGATLSEVAAAFGLSASTVRQRLIVAGWSSSTGEPTFQDPPDQPWPHPTFQFVNQPWADDALCAQTDSEVFFPEKGGSTRAAKDTCARCPVAAQCLDYALVTHERFGVWGGFSERERRALTPAQGAPVHAVGATGAAS